MIKILERVELRTSPPVRPSLLSSDRFPRPLYRLFSSREQYLGWLTRSENSGILFPIFVNVLPTNPTCHKGLKPIYGGQREHRKCIWFIEVNELPSHPYKSHQRGRGRNRGLEFLLRGIRGKNYLSIMDSLSLS